MEKIACCGVADKDLTRVEVSDAESLNYTGIEQEILTNRMGMCQIIR